MAELNPVVDILTAAEAITVTSSAYRTAISKELVNNPQINSAHISGLAEKLGAEETALIAAAQNLKTALEAASKEQQ